jgi:hypothetical protein
MQDESLLDEFYEDGEQPDELNDDIPGVPLEHADLPYVYFLSLVDPDDPARDLQRVKVGTTKTDVEKRIAQLQTGNPHAIRCLAAFRSPVARQVEHWVHRTHAAMLVNVEWLRIPRDDVAPLVAAAQKEAKRLGRIARNIEKWSSTLSNGRERAPSKRQLDIYTAAGALRVEIRGVELRAGLVASRIFVAAGQVERVPGILKVQVSPASYAFSGKLAAELFPDLFAEHLFERIEGRFCWKGMGRPSFSVEIERERAALTADVEALDAAILTCGVSSEAPRTQELSDLHAEYLSVKERQSRLKLDEEEFKSALIQELEDFEAIRGVCSYRRATHERLDSKGFRRVHPVQAEQCRVERRAHVRRQIFMIRSY